MNNILKEVNDILSDRGDTHGSADDLFKTIAEMWSAYSNTELTPGDVAAMMALFKTARIKANPAHRDSYIDAIGYVVLAIELNKGEDR